LDSHIPSKNERTETTIRSVLAVPGVTARAMRSAEDLRPDATEPNVFVFYIAVRQLSRMGYKESKSTHRVVEN
jgi:hypothetical protein